MGVVAHLPPSRRPKGFITPAARRALRLGRASTRLTHPGPSPHANPGRRQQLRKERRRRQTSLAALATSDRQPPTPLEATQRKRMRVRRSLMHEWKYREVAEQLSPRAKSRLHGRFLALLRSIQGSDDAGSIPTNVRQRGAGAIRSGGPQRTAPPAAGKHPEAVQDGPRPSRPLKSRAEPARRAGVLQERRSGNAPCVPTPASKPHDQAAC